MKVLNQLFKKTRGKDKDLVAAASAIVALENKLAKKEAEADDLRVSLDELYQAATLGKRNQRKINKTKEAFSEIGEEIAGLKSVIDAAKTEAIELAQTEIKDSLTYKTELQEQMKLEINEENAKIIATMQELILAIYRVYGIRGAISKDATRFSISTSTMPDADILKANQELAAVFDSTTTGPNFTALNIKEIEEQTAKADPKKLVETALQDARNSLAQGEKKAA